MNQNKGGETPPEGRFHGSFYSRHLRHGTQVRHAPLITFIPITEEL